MRNDNERGMCAKSGADRHPKGLIPIYRKTLASMNLSCAISSNDIARFISSLEKFIDATIEEKNQGEDMQTRIPTIQPYLNTPNDMKIKSLLRSVSRTCDSLSYRDEYSEHDKHYRHNVTDSLEDTAKRDRLLKQIIELADVARSHSFTSDTMHRDLLSDIFTEIFIKAKEIQTITNYGTTEERTTRNYVNNMLDESRLRAEAQYDVNNCIGQGLPEFGKNPLRARATFGSFNNPTEIRLLSTSESDSFILRLGTNDYHVLLMDGKFLVNGLASDTVTFDEKVNI